MAVLPGILADENLVAVLFACVLLAVIVLAGAYVAMWLRRRYWAEDDGKAPNVGFTLDDLRELNRSGQISDEEFARAKEKVLQAHRGAAGGNATVANAPVDKPPSQGP
jgi:uncharacterized membrane protein